MNGKKTEKTSQSKHRGLLRACQRLGQYFPGKAIGVHQKSYEFIKKKKKTMSSVDKDVNN